MRKATTSNEVLISANKLSKELGVNRGLIHYWAIRLKLRYFKLNGVRCLYGTDNAICLVKNLAARHNIPQDKVDDTINRIQTKC